MRNIFLVSSIALTTCLSLTLNCLKASALDVNLNGGANLNINNANNNKYSTKMTNFAPGNVPLGTVDLTPLATPPATGTVESIAGGSQILNVVGKATNNATEAKELQRQTGQFVGKAPESVADDQEVKHSDIQDFLANYYKYLRTEGLSSASPPVIPNSNSSSKINSSTKNTSLLNTETGTPVELQAKEQKLLISKTPTVAKDQNPDSP